MYLLTLGKVNTFFYIPFYFYFHLVKRCFRLNQSVTCAKWGSYQISWNMLSVLWHHVLWPIYIF